MNYLYSAMSFFLLRRFVPALIASIVLLLLWGAQPSVSAQTSLLPTENVPLSGAELSVGDSKHIKDPQNCIELRNLLTVYPDQKALEGKYLAMKIQCGRMTLGDITFYAKHILQFLFDVLGTLAVVAIIRAGYLYMLSKDKNAADGKKVIRQVAVGLAVAIFSFTAVRFLFSFVLSFGG